MFSAYRPRASDLGAVSANCSPIAVRHVPRGGNTSTSPAVTQVVDQATTRRYASMELGLTDFAERYPVGVREAPSPGQRLHSIELFGEQVR